jgi:20S proteasome alpha/beta subunit
VSVSPQVYYSLLKFPNFLKGKRVMTIAIGHRCADGVLVAADRQVTKEDLSKTSESKVLSFSGVSGIFAIACASENLNATRTVINKIKAILSTISINDDNHLETHVTKIMADWYGTYGQIKPPESVMILGSRLNGQKAKLFRCEPPSTFLFSPSYVAAGAGESVTDPIYDLLFDVGSGTVIQALRRVCYLMYRAKKDNAFCGGSTMCIYLGDSRNTPVTVRPTDILDQEESSKELDFFLTMAATLTLESAPETIKTNAVGLGEALEALADIRKTKFHELNGKILE